MELTEAQIAEFSENGYLVIPNFLPTSGAASVDSLRKRITEIVEGFDLSEKGEIFTTKEQSRAAGDYFLSSGGKIRFFWEENARTAEGELTRVPELCINKIGHNLHDLDQDFELVSYDVRVAKICRDLGMELPKVVQSMYIFKQPFIGGEVGAHQDGAFLYTEPQSVLGFWWALDHCSQENGCLWAVPGSHRLGVHRRFRRRDPPDVGVEFVPSEPVSWDLSDAKPLECSAGTLVLLHNAVVHFSGGNSSPSTRHAYSIHVIDGKPGVVYPEDNWLQRDEPFKELKL